MDGPATTEAPGRPWAAGAGLGVLGLFVAAVGNGFALHGTAGALGRGLGLTAWAAGVGIVGAGVHRLLWARGSPRPPAVRLVVTALVTPVAFAGGALFFSVLFSILQLRFRS